MLPACGVGRSAFRPTVAAGDALWNEPRLPAGGATRLTTGRANVRGGGATVDLPAFAPSIVVRVGFTSSERVGVALLSSFGETLMLFRATDREFTSVSRDTAVNPFGARMLAKCIDWPPCNPPLPGSPTLGRLLMKLLL